MFQNLYRYNIPCVLGQGKCKLVLPMIFSLPKKYLNTIYEVK